MTKFTDHIHSEILNIAEKNLNSDQGVSHDNFDNILTDISVCMEKLGIKENIIDEVTSSCQSYYPIQKRPTPNVSLISDLHSF